MSNLLTAWNVETPVEAAGDQHKAVQFLRKIDQVLRGRWSNLGLRPFFPPFYLAVERPWARIVWSVPDPNARPVRRVAVQVGDLVMELMTINETAGGNLLFGEALRKYLEQDPRYPRTELSSQILQQALRWAGIKY